MAIIIPGIKCPLCKLQISKEQEIISFPAFISNRRDPLWLFSDGVFHSKCFKEEPLGEQAATISAKVMTISAPHNRICAVCGANITNPDDYIFLGHLTSDKSSPLYEFNYVQLHLSHAPEWQGLKHFIDAATKILQQKEWDGITLGWLIAKLTSFKGSAV